MKKFWTLLFIILTLFLACNKLEGEGETKSAVFRNLVGEISKKELTSEPYAKWFSKNYSEYIADSLELSQLISNLNGVEIKVILGTWCSDSRREISRLFKILNSIQYPEDKISMLAVDKNQFRNERDSIEEINDLNIIRVPTIILLRGDKEMGRIIEYPVQSLEKDMNLILTTATYRPKYYKQSEKNKKSNNNK